jgi:pimeloyl-ACP methyl ester carboxylesterase
MNATSPWKPRLKSAGVFLHGFRSDCDGSKAIALAQHAEHRGYSWVRFDLSGHGRSDGDFTTFTITDAVRDVLAVLEALAPRPVVLVGSSLGGWLSVLAAQHAPQQVRAMLLIAPAFNFVQNFLAALPAEELRRWARQGIRRFSRTRTRLRLTPSVLKSSMGSIAMTCCPSRCALSAR